MSAMFSSGNLVDDAAISATNEVATLPAPNLSSPVVQKVWRSLVTTATLNIDFGSAGSIRVLGLFGCTMLAGDTVRHKLSTVSQGATDVLDTGAINCGVVNGYGQHVYLLSAATSVRYWTIVFNVPSRSAAGYVDIGRAWAGPIWDPDITFAYGWGEQWNDTADVPRANRSGVAFPSEGAAFRSLSVSFECLSESDRADALDMDRICGRHKQILFIPDSAGDLFRRPILGRMTDTSIIKQPDDRSPDAFAKSYDIEQDL